MQEEGFEHLSGLLKARDIGLSWLLGVTSLRSERAVPLKPHRHAHLEAIFCLKGELTYEIDGMPSVTLGADMGLVIPAQTLHVLKGGTNAPGERLGFHFAHTPSAVRTYSVFSPTDYLSFRKTLETSAGQLFRLGKTLAESVAELATTLRRPPETITPPEMGLVRILCCTILYHVVKTLSEPLAPVRPQLMAEAVAFLETHSAEPIKSVDLVRHMGYSRARLFALFKAYTGLTPNDYLTRLRVRNAEELLKRGVGVAETARAVGYADAAYFGAVFKRYTGSTPGSFLSRPIVSDIPPP